MKKIIILFVLFFILLFLPIPYYDSSCPLKLCTVGGCPSDRGCSSMGWRLHYPLILNIYSFFFPQSALSPDKRVTN